MASYLTQVLELHRRLSSRRNKTQGFTLTELLVSILISTIIIGTLLYVVVELLGVNTREESLTKTQQDMRRALDYINADVSESVWVYADPATVVSQLTDLPTDDAGDPDDLLPVLAFWRIDPVDTEALDDDCSTYGAQEEECEALKVRQFAHTLVVYLQQENSGDDIWEGPRRIVRYELTKYDNVATLAQNAGYLDPSTNEFINTDGEIISFGNWEREGSATDGTAAALTDFVDDPTVDNAGNPTPVTCPDGYAGAATARDNFYVCVSGDANVRENRSLLVFLRGSTFEDNQVVFGPTSEASRLPVLQSEVFVRGVVEEQPDFED